MEIQRIGVIPASAEVPAFSLAVVHGSTVYLCGMTADLDGKIRAAGGDLGDVKRQTRDILGRIDALLARAGTSKSRLLAATVWLTDMDDFAAMNSVWNEWVDPQNPPARACLLSPRLFRPGLLVEIMVTAAALG